MPKCVTCREVLHPDYCVVVDEATNACKCVFCKTGKDEITLTNTETGEYIDKVTKKEAVENYKRYLVDLKDNPKIRKIIMGEMHKGAKLIN